jgi:uncharacterized protein YuzE
MNPFAEIFTSITKKKKKPKMNITKMNINMAGKIAGITIYKKNAILLR